MKTTTGSALVLSKTLLQGSSDLPAALTTSNSSSDPWILFIFHIAAWTSGRKKTCPTASQMSLPTCFYSFPDLCEQLETSVGLDQ
ncbi:hypothetical protein Y1Q_0017740 [Alligator mississippiensis]|uniref:Uncharacterized protein n=1 Tax=Alligator mississippiensis TaxID=8496 RepID=A0A151MKP9_ALLMI|nr:hypothetical protein Y1Q_0017740 [Alligator mississippiensis]